MVIRTTGSHASEVARMRRDVAFLRNALLLVACIAVFLAVAVIAARALG